jgi:hypothetical protein
VSRERDGYADARLRPLLLARDARIAELEAENKSTHIQVTRLSESRDKAEAALDELDSYNGHLAWMDKHYPLDVSYFAESEDVGCQVMRLSRKVMQAEAALAERDRMLRKVWDEGDGNYFSHVRGFDGWLSDLRNRANGICPYCGKDATIGIHHYCGPADATWSGARAEEGSGDE